MNVHEVSTLRLLKQWCTDLSHQQGTLHDTANIICPDLFAHGEVTPVRHLYAQERPPVTSVEYFPIVFSALTLVVVASFTFAIIIRTLLQSRESRRGPIDGRKKHEIVRSDDDQRKFTCGVPSGDFHTSHKSHEIRRHHATVDEQMGCNHDDCSSPVDAKQAPLSFEIRSHPSVVSETAAAVSKSRAIESKEEKRNETETNRGDLPQPSNTINDFKYPSSSSKTNAKDGWNHLGFTQDQDKHQDFSSKGQQRKKSDEKKNTVLSWRGIGCSYPSTNPNVEPIVTLKSACGVLRTQELTAIMGASGSGKSTLLDILSGRKNLGILEGEMSIEGNVVTIEEAGVILKDIAAYVPQSEMFFPTQTPEEAVMFFANLKLGRDKRGHTYRQHCISNLLDQVGLSITARMRPIGGLLAGGLTIRGLSGGERKRLALACAVIMRPSILFLDEITRYEIHWYAVLNCRSLLIFSDLIVDWIRRMQSKSCNYSNDYADE